MSEITEGVIDFLRVYSVHIKRPREGYPGVGIVYTVIVVLNSAMINHPIYCIVDMYADNMPLCRSESELRISDLARRRLRRLMCDIALPLIQMLKKGERNER